MESTRKIFVLDTNVLMHDPEAIFKFAEHRLILPISVIEELDQHKKDLREVGRNARQALRNVNKLIDENKFGNGEAINATGGTFEVALSEDEFKHMLPSDLKWEVVDNKILSVAKAFGAILVSKDTAIRIKAKALDIPSEDYSNDKVDISELYTGHREGYISEDNLNLLYEQGHIDKSAEVLVEDDVEYYPNMYVTLKSLDNPKHSAIVRYDSVMGIFGLLSGALYKPSGLTPRNSEQLMAMDAILNPDIKLVTLVGKAGCGKTLVALAGALDGVLDTQEYTKLLVARPIVPMGADIGYLPGSMEEKLAPWTAPIFENIDFLMDISMKEVLKAPKKTAEKPVKGQKCLKKSTVRKELEDEYYAKEFAKMPGAQELIANGKLEVAAITYIRGRTLPNLALIIDECQNLTPHEVKTIITRIGEGSKIILTGDIEQIDAAYLDSSSNGLSYLVDRFKNEKISAHITLTKSERSELSEIASRIL